MDLRKVKKLIELVEESGLAELEVSSAEESVRIVMPRGQVHGASVGYPVAAVSGAPVNAAPQVQSASASASEKVHTPMAGTFYRAPHPDAEPFVEVGGRVNAGETLCIIESMKMLHEIPAPESGRVVAIPVNNGEPVATGDVLIVLQGDS